MAEKKRRNAHSVTK